MARIKFYWLVLGTALAAAAVSAGAAESAGDVGVPKPEAAAATAAGSGSQVTGKGAGMGKIYQQNLPGPGHGAPESQGSAAGSGAQLENSAGETLQPGDDAEAAGADAQSHELRSRKARDGSGYGAGPGGERGLGSEGAPHHQQYGSPPSPRGVDE